MVTEAAWLAALLYVLPVLVLLVTRSRRERPLWAMALDIPLAVAADGLLICTLARFMPLERAVLTSRGLWLTGLWSYLAWRKRPEIRWPRALTKGRLATVLLAAALAALLSVAFSRECHGFDRGWHIPLSTSLRAQRLPFQNVYQPGIPLAYHYGGDVIAAAVQTLSYGIVHASLALSITHDVMYALSGATVALLMFDRGARSPAFVLLGAVAPLLAGPANIGWAERASQGYSVINLLKLGFRPHTSVAYLLLIGVAGAILVRITARQRPDAEEPPLRETAPILILGTAMMAITDETSIGVMGLVAGYTWMLMPQSLGTKWWHGAVVLGGMLLALVGASFGLHGALASDIGQQIAWVPARAPGYYRPPVWVRGGNGEDLLAADLAPTALVWLGMALLLFRERPRRSQGAVAMSAVLVILSVLLLTHVDIGQRSVESHRFMTAAMLLVPLAGVMVASGPARGLGLPQALVAGGLALGAVGSLDWLHTEGEPGASRCPKPKLYLAEEDFFDIDCREAVGAHFGERPRIAYLERKAAYIYAGCRPIYTAGPRPRVVESDRVDIQPRDLREVQQWNTHVGRMLFDQQALAGLSREILAPNQPLTLICALESDDRLCKAAHAHRLPCARVGTQAELCILPRHPKTKAVWSLIDGMVKRVPLPEPFVP